MSEAFAAGCVGILLLFAGSTVAAGVAAQSRVDEASTTPARPPLAVESNEATAEQLESAKGQGRAARAALDWLLKAAPFAAETNAGEYHVACLLSAPEGSFLPGDGGLRWHSPAGNTHLRAIIRDGADGRVIPYLNVRAEIFHRDGALVQTVPLSFGWYPLLNGYGANVRLPNESTVRITIEPPNFHRHDPYNGDRFTQLTTATFPNIKRPRLSASSLADREAHQLSLAKAEGDAFEETLKQMFQQANDGAQKRIGDYQVAVAVEYAEAWWFYESDRFVYKYEEELSAQHNAHVEIAPRDARTGRFLPAEHVTATVIDEKGNTLGTVGEHFMWHPWLYHYGDNWRVPHTASYRLIARFDPPAYPRYGREAGRRFARPVEIAFDNIKIKTGEK